MPPSRRNGNGAQGTRGQGQRTRQRRIFVVCPKELCSEWLWIERVKSKRRCLCGSASNQQDVE